MRDQLIDQIFEIIKDYHSDIGFEMSKERINEWSNQFEPEDSDFVLSEFLHLLQKGIYISKEKGKEILFDNLVSIAALEKYSELQTFLWETRFILSQSSGKSQDVLFNLLREICNEKLGFELNQDMHIPVKNYIYLDDVLATGKTIYEDLKTWLLTEDHLNNVIQSKTNLYVSLFACHLRGFENNNWRFKLDFGKDEIMKTIKLQTKYEIDDRVLYPSSKLNFALPIQGSSATIDNYFNELTQDQKEKIAYRNPQKPSIEQFFSSKENRKRFETIIGSKGVEILSKVKTLNPAHRPFGATFPSYKTLGTGTLFFTWRNISNTCPIIFWWDHPAHNWKSLFPLQNRG